MRSVHDSAEPAGAASALCGNSEAAGIGGGIGPGQDGRRLVTFCVEAAGLKATLAKIEGLGGKTTMAPMEVLGGPVIALFADPEGNVIGLVKEGSM